jgi:N-dimethylarginine dimethylaminohydrolase
MTESRTGVSPKTAHSEYGALQTVFLKRVEDAFIDDKNIDRDWQPLHFTGRPNLETAREEYLLFEAHIRDSGADIRFLPADGSLTMDSLYCRDAALSTNGGMVLCNMGKALRRAESAAQKAAFLAHDIPVLGEIEAPGTLEGGDCAWLDEHTLAVAHSYRTNEEGIRQLRRLLQPLDVAVLDYSLPHYKGPSDVFHLMSVFSPVDKDLAVVYSPLMPIAFRNELLRRGYQLVEVPAEEFEMACNVLALAPRRCLMLEGYPRTKRALEDAGAIVLTYPGEEISAKGGGGPTCMSRPVWRSI